MEESERLQEVEGVSGGGRKGSWVRGRYMHGECMPKCRALTY